MPSGGGQLLVDGVALFWVDSRIGFDKVKVVAKPHSAGTSRTSSTTGGIKSGLVHVGKVYPCRDKSFRKAVSTVKDDLVKVVR